MFCTPRSRERSGADVKLPVCGQRGIDGIQRNTRRLVRPCWWSLGGGATMPTATKNKQAHSVGHSSPYADALRQVREAQGPPPAVGWVGVPASSFLRRAGKLQNSIAIQSNYWASFAQRKRKQVCPVRQHLLSRWRRSSRSAKQDSLLRRLRSE